MDPESPIGAEEISQNHARHYKPPVIHVIGSRPAESYVKFNENHVTWDKPETRDSHALAQKPKTQARYSNRHKTRRFEPSVPNGPTGQQLSPSYRPLDSESSDNTHSYHDNPLNYDDYGYAPSKFPAQGSRDIALLYPNNPETVDPIHTDTDPNFYDESWHPSGNKLKMEIVDGHMYVTQNSKEDHMPSFKTRKHEAYIFVSLLVCACFNCPVGTIALCLSIKSQNLFDNGRKRKAKVIANVSLVVSMVGMVTGVFTVIAMVFYLAHLQEQEKIWQITSTCSSYPCKHVITIDTIGRTIGRSQ